ncbi:MAG: DUF6029 family protein [bacterium JZ-2024 1]
MKNETALRYRTPRTLFLFVYIAGSLLWTAAGPFSFTGSFYFSGSADRLSVTRKAESELSLTGSSDQWLIGFRGDNYSPFPSRAKDLRVREGFLEYHTADWEWRAGSFRDILGTGLVFSSYRLRELDIENTVAGVRASYQAGERWNALLFSARGMEDNKENRLTGGHLQYSIAEGLTLTLEGLLSEIPAGTRETRFRIAGLYAVYSAPRTDLSLEAATLNQTGSVQRSGHAYYGYFSHFIFPRMGLSIFAGYKDYKKFSHFYNLGPTLRSQFESTNYDDEVGFQIGIAYVPTEKLSIRVNQNKSDTRGFPLPFRENELTVHLTPGNAWEELYGYWRAKSDFTELEKDIEVNLIRRMSENLKVVLNYYAEDHEAPQQKYEVRQTTLGFHIGSSPLYLGGTFQKTTRASEPQRDWGYLEVHYPIRQALRVQVQWGSDRGGRQCASGICVIRPPMEGNRFEIIGLF